MWEIDSSDEVRVVNDARSGNRAIWLGGFNGHEKRNEIIVNNGATWDETWISFSMKIVDPIPRARTYAQWRNARDSGGVGDGVINPLTIRQGDPGKLYFSTATIERNVNTIFDSGASTGTQSTHFDYEVGEWIDFLIHWKLDPEDGFIRIWVDEELIVDEEGTTTYRFANIDGEPYNGNLHITLGPYWSHNNPPQGNIYYDNYKIWRVN